MQTYARARAHTHIYIYVHIKVKLAIIVEGDLKVPFSIATTPRGKEGYYSFPLIVPLYRLSLPSNAGLLSKGA